MTVTFLVPRRADGGYRDRLWEFCRSWWSTKVPGWDITEGASPDGPFNRSAALNDAARKAGDWDVAVIIDADVVADPLQVRQAVTGALETGAVVLGFTDYHGLTPAATRRVLAGDEPTPAGRIVTKREHESSIVVVPRTAWETIGGFDERFVGWGQEDVAFAHSARLLVGLRRVPGPVYHLWHERTRERVRSSETYKANQELGQAYREAFDEDSVRAVRSGGAAGRRRSAFGGIWRRNAWNGKETPAGPGSSQAATKALQDWLPSVLAEFNITSVLDAGCAEAYWLPDLPGYVGMDIVPEAVKAAMQRWPDRTFILGDVVTDTLLATDAILCRDVLQHLPLADGVAALENFRRSARYLIASTHDGERNVDIRPGRWYPVNMMAEPFDLGEPLRSLPDGVWSTGVRYPNKRIGLWDLAP